MKKLERTRHIKFYLFVSACLIVIFFILLEVTLRVVSPPNVYTPLLPLYPNVKMKLSPKLNGVSSEAMYTTNSWGLRGDEPPWDWEDTLTIVAVGGSTTQCFYLDDKKAWPFLLQESLKSSFPKVWVGNGGIDGQSSRAHIVFFREVLSEISPDIAVVLVGVNDLMISLNERERINGRGFDRRPNRPRNLTWLEKQSRTVQLSGLWYEILFNDAIVKVETGHGNFKPTPFVADDNNSLPKNLKELLPGLEEYRENLKTLSQLGKAIGTRVVFMTQPMMFDNTPEWEKISGYLYFNAENTQRMSAAMTWQLMNIFNKELLDFCGQEKLDCIDLAAEIPHSSKMFYDGVHFTEIGAERVADVVSDYLKEKK